MNIKEYIYPSMKIEQLMKKLNKRIYKIINVKILINEDNRNKDIRKQNISYLYNILSKFFVRHSHLYNKILYEYDDIYFVNFTLSDNHNNYFNDFDNLIVDIICNLVYDYSQRKNEYKDIKIFKDQTSLCCDIEIF